ncbi:MAG: hypothetical protein H9855_15690 [Candidatus Acinetobacter avistercoris]|nr:hypothetical protein [Candidatus Acinetobacter avistercoris]
MDMNIKRIICVFSLLLSTSVYAEDQLKSEEYLHNYGIAYCLSHAEHFKEEAGIAMGGYFQLGSHNVDTAKQVEKYIAHQLKTKLDGYQASDLQAYLMRCLEISYSKEYREYILDALWNDALKQLSED